MTRILVLYYSQSGDVARVVESLTKPFEGADIECTVEEIRPEIEYPYPWKSVGRFFDPLPECILGPAPAIHPFEFDVDARFDLVILAYQAWFLSPSLPVQGFLASDAARVLRNRKVMTVSVSRNMWQSASERMKGLLSAAGAIHIDNVVVTHQGPPWATFVSVPRALLWGKRDSLWGIFPPAGIDEGSLAKVARFGEAIVERLSELVDPAQGSLLRGLGAVEVNRRYMIPELVGSYGFRMWAHVIRALGRVGRWARTLGVYLFAMCLVPSIVIGIPIASVVTLLLYPLIKRSAAQYAARLRKPSEE